MKHEPGTIVAMTGVTKEYGDTRALENVSFGVPAGQVCGLLGMNGAGKTTALAILTGIITSTTGDATCDGLRPEDDRFAQSVGFLSSQDCIIEPAWSPKRYLNHFAALHDLDPKEADARIAHLARALGLDRFLSVPIQHLSSGNRRKVDLLRAILHRPRVLLLDEPTRELDLSSKRAVWQLLRAEAASGRAVLLTSHDVEEIASSCDRVVVLRRGHVVRDARVADLGAPLADALVTVLEGRGAVLEELVDEHRQLTRGAP